MTIIQAIILGLIQGLSEFIPISSTAHLTIAGHVFGLMDTSNPEHWTAFIATIQLGTMLAVIIYFAKELLEIPSNFLRDNFTKNRKKIAEQSLPSRLGWFIIIGTVPIVTIGMALKKVIEGHITKDLSVIAFSLIGLALVLALAEKTAKFRKDMTSIRWVDALIVGLCQCVALIPGASRSGTTLTGGLFLGIKRDDAARFSFLLSIPAVLASGLLEFYQSISYITSADTLNIIVATIVAGVSGYFSISFLLKYLRTRTTNIFVIYRILLGLGIMYMIWG